MLASQRSRSPSLCALTDEECINPGALGVLYRKGMQIIGKNVVRDQFRTIFPEIWGIIPVGSLWIEHHRKEVPVVISEDEARFIVENGGVLLHIQCS